GEPVGGSSDDGASVRCVSGARACGDSVAASPRSPDTARGSTDFCESLPGPWQAVANRPAKTIRRAMRIPALNAARAGKASRAPAPRARARRSTDSEPRGGLLRSRHEDRDLERQLDPRAAREGARLGDDPRPGRAVP